MTTATKEKQVKYFGNSYPCIVSIDPGAITGFAIWTITNKRPDEWGITKNGYQKHIFKIQKGLLIIEDQYLGVNFKSAKSVITNKGRWIERAATNKYHIIEIMASTWQSSIKARGKRTERKAQAKFYAESCIIGVAIKDQDACDAICQGQVMIDKWRLVLNAEKSSRTFEDNQKCHVK